MSVVEATLSAVPVQALPVGRYVGPWVAAAAGWALFCELLVIRLHASYLQLFAYFKNISLLSCFLGLGIGYALGARRRVRVDMVLPMLAVQVVALFLIRRSSLAASLQNPVADNLTLGLDHLGTLPLTYLVILGFFAFNAYLFVPLGQLAAALMERMPPLRAYAWNLAGSVVGIGAFSLLAFAWAPPAVWVAVAGAVAILFVWRNPRSLVVTLLAVALAVGVLVQPGSVGGRDYYSPYQILTLSSEKQANGTEVPIIATSNTYYQRILDLRPEMVARYPEGGAWESYYALPYQFVPNLQAVLVVGSGTGNDVTAALRHGARTVDAVEIDPLILRLGRELHPEQPYHSPRVTVTVADARAYIRDTARRYDLIVYGLLDSHTLLTAQSGGIRLDSYVYTVEAFREARSKLKEGGMVSLSFSIMDRRHAQKVKNMLTEAFDGIVPRVFDSRYDLGLTFLTGRGSAFQKVPAPAGMREVTAEFVPPTSVDSSTDDWPFFYMPVRRYPVSYVLLFAIILAASWRLLRRSFKGYGVGFSWSAFCLGVGFMLIETKGITELALYFGSTWLVISLVIASLLVLAFLANWYVMKLGKPPLGRTYLCLLASIGIGYLATFYRSQLLDLPAGSSLAALLLTLPMLFSGIAFSAELEHRASVGVVLSSNIFGAMVGGVLEYNAMYFGFRALYLIALAVYVLAWLGVPRTSRAGAAASPPAFSLVDRQTW